MAFLQEDSIKLPVPTSKQPQSFCRCFFLKKSGLTVHAPAPALVLPTAAAKVVHSVAAIPATPALALLASLVASSACRFVRIPTREKIISEKLFFPKIEEAHLYITV